MWVFLQLDHLWAISNLIQNVLFHSLISDQKQKGLSETISISWKKFLDSFYKNYIPLCFPVLKHLGLLLIYRSASCPVGVNYKNICSSKQKSQFHRKREKKRKEKTGEMVVPSNLIDWQTLCLLQFPFYPRSKPRSWDQLVQVCLCTGAPKEKKKWLKVGAHHTRLWKINQCSTYPSLQFVLHSSSTNEDEIFFHHIR